MSKENFLDLCDTITVDVNNKQTNVVGDISIDTDSPIKSSFHFGSGTTLADEEETVYFVFEPNDNLGEPIQSHSEANTQIATKVFSSTCNINVNSDEKNGNQIVNEENHKIIPGRTRAGVTKCLELGCNFVCSRIPQLRVHLEEVHGIPQERKLFAFNSEKDFKSWLSAVEKEARCTFMRRRGWQTNKNGSSTACFYCHRGGAYTSKATKKQMKTQGSCKTGVECTSSMKVTMWTVPDKCEKNKGPPVKHVQVEAYLQHYGHNLDLNHTRITKAEKDDIARKLSCGISRNKILDDIRGTLDASKSPHRLHLLSLQDLYNIEKKEGIKARKRNSNDDEGTTVQAWIEKMQKSEENPVLLIKYQQEKAKEVCSCLSDDDFILILQTPLQAMMLRKYGPHQSICIDITRGDSGSNGGKSETCFYLMAIEVIIPILNDREEVFPVAWFVCNRKDDSVIRIFFSEIKKNLSDLTLTPSNLLFPDPGTTGSCDWFHLWTSIFGPGPRKLFCSWHILSSWKQRVQRTSLKGTHDESRLITNLQTVLLSTVLDEFVRLLEDFISDLSGDANTLSLVNYFKSAFSSQPEVWSRAYRSEVQLQTEAKFEDFHNKTVRHIYHEGFKRKQLDVLIKTLMRHSRDRALNKLRQTFKLTNERSIRHMTSSNHAAGSKLPSSFVTSRKESRSWSVMSVIDRVRAVERSTESGKPILLKQVAVEYIVRCADVDRCPARLMCAYRCSDCEICSHHFTCSCQSDQKSLFPGDGLPILCEHCHLVVRYMRENLQQVDSLFPPPPADSADDQDQNVDESSSATDRNQVVVMVIEDAPQSASIGNDEAAKEKISLLNQMAAIPLAAEEETISTQSLLIDKSSVVANSTENDAIECAAENDVTTSTSPRRSARRRNVSYNCKQFPAADFALQISAEKVTKPSSKRRKVTEASES